MVKIIKTKNAETFMQGTPAYSTNAAKYKAAYAVTIEGKTAAYIQPNTTGGYEVRSINGTKLFAASFKQCWKFAESMGNSE